MQTLNTAIYDRLCVLLLKFARHRKDGLQVEAFDFIHADLGLDSLDTIELAMDIEEEFGITLPDTEWEQGPDRRVSDVVDLIVAKLDGRA